MLTRDLVHCAPRQEMYFRHLYAVQQPSLDARCDSWANYQALFGVILHSNVNMQLPNGWLWDIIDEFVCVSSFQCSVAMHVCTLIFTTIAISGHRKAVPSHDSYACRSPLLNNDKLNDHLPACVSPLHHTSALWTYRILLRLHTCVTRLLSHGFALLHQSQSICVSLKNTKH